MFHTILFHSIASLILASFITLVVWVILLVVLRKINKYTIKNFWFWALSVLIIPFAVISLSLIISAQKIQNKVVIKAQNYAVGLVATVNAAPHNVIDAATAIAQGKVDGLADKAHGDVASLAAGVAAGVTDNVIDNVAMKVDSYIPENIISLIIDKFPSLSYFLKNHKIEGNTDEELVSSIFAIVNNNINHFQGKIGSILTVTVLAFLLLVFLVGYLKLALKSRGREIVNSNE